MRARVVFCCLFVAVVLALGTSGAHALPSGIIAKRSPYDVTQTLDRLEDLLKKNGFTVISRLDLRAIAKQGGETIAAAQLLIVSSAEFEARLLKSERTIGLELPIKLLVWEDASGHVTIGYTDPERLVQRYNVGNQPVAVQHMVQLLDQLTDDAVKP
jgi:uncharacterized protein (DUF302 family)